MEQMLTNMSVAGKEIDHGHGGMIIEAADF
jgi:hypothetical protein